MSVPLRFVAATYRYPSSAHDAIRDVTLTVEAGSIVGVLGPNGGGKTTLVRLAMGLLTPTSGTVQAMEGDPDIARRLGQIGYVSQQRPMAHGVPVSAAQFIELSISAGLRGTRSLTEQQRDRIEWAMEVTGADVFADKPIGELSGGQLQRAMIARAIALEPVLLLLDEPTVGIDVKGQAAFSTMLDAVRAQTNCGVLVVSHDLRAVVAGCDRIACLNRTLHAHVSPEGLTPGVLAEVFAHEVEGVLGAVHVEAHLAADCDHDHSHQHPPVESDKP